MSDCSFCNAKEDINAPVCQSCGALRYPVTAHATPSRKQDKLKLSATIAVAIFTPGSFLVLALVGANKLSNKMKTGKY